MTPRETGTGTDPETSAAPGAGRGHRVGALAVLLVPVLMIGVGGWLHRWTDEDAFINFRIVDQLFAGHGPVFNAGERIETYTSAAWLGVLALGRVAVGWVMGPEWISVLLGLASAVGGFAFAVFAGRALFRRDERQWVLPLGLTAVAAVPVVWDFATSGLEMGLVWLWIGLCFFALARVAASGTPTGRLRPVWLVVIGIGPLVRPDLALMTLAFLAGWFLLASPRRVVHDLAWAFAIPLAYQVFRMGYFASLVPSTALAKDSGGVHLDQGWRYLTDLVGTYALWVPLAALVIAMVVRAVRGSDRSTNVVVAAVVGAGVLHAGYMVVSGGDYMHGRLLLPALFAVAAPATFALPDRARTTRPVLLGAVTAVVVCWAVVVVGAVRYPPQDKDFFGVAEIADWRLLMHRSVHHHSNESLTIGMYDLRRMADRGTHGYLRLLDTEPRPGRDPRRLVITLGAIGIPGWVVGPDAFVVDIGGLAEPIAAHTAPVAGRAAGHRKNVPIAWYDARFGAAPGSPRTRAARRALACPPLRDLLDAVDRPLTAGRFLSNLWHAPGYTVMRIPRDPEAAERKFCGRR